MTGRGYCLELRLQLARLVAVPGARVALRQPRRHLGRPTRLRDRLVKDVNRSRAVARIPKYAAEEVIRHRERRVELDRPVQGAYGTGAVAREVIDHGDARRDRH